MQPAAASRSFVYVCGALSLNRIHCVAVSFSAVTADLLAESHDIAILPEGTGRFRFKVSQVHNTAHTERVWLVISIALLAQPLTGVCLTARLLTLRCSRLVVA